jgi:hypothetical protein
VSSVKRNVAPAVGPAQSTTTVTCPPSLVCVSLAGGLAEAVAGLEASGAEDEQAATRTPTVRTEATRTRWRFTAG